MFVLPPAAALAASRSVKVSVPAAQWISTGVHVNAGNLLRITATGSWSDGGTTSGPNGAAKWWPDNFFNLADLGVCNYCAKTATSQWGALIGYIGAAPPAPGSYTSAAVRPRALKVFYVGGNYEARALASGRLWLAKNADAYSDYTSDNHGHVVARISTLSPGSARRTAARARAAVYSARAAAPLQLAANTCARAVLYAFSDYASSEAIKAALDKLLPGAGDVFDGATIIATATGDYIEISYELSNGQIANGLFDIGRVVFAILGEIPGLELFGIVGDPAIYCAEAAFWLDGKLAGQLGQLIRHKLWPPATEAAGIMGTWTLHRSIVVCVHLATCSTSPLHMRFRHCGKTKCAMSTTTGAWKSVIVRHGISWVADFKALAFTCGSQFNPGHLIFRLAVTGTHRRGGIVVAKSLAGTLTATAATNPPNCPGNAHALEALRGSRS